MLSQGERELLRDRTEQLLGDVGMKVESEALTAAERERVATAIDINNSDIDFCDHQGHLAIFYSWGNQQGVEHLAEAVQYRRLDRKL